MSATSKNKLGYSTLLLIVLAFVVAVVAARRLAARHARRS